MSLLYPHLRCILFDLPTVIEGAEHFIEQEFISDRCETVSGDFFKSVPVIGDAYILARIIHDWDDSHAVTILRNIRHRIPKHGKLLIVDYVISYGYDASYETLSDIVMLTLFEGGRERTEAEFRDILQKSGFEIADIIPTLSAMSIIECIPIVWKIKPEQTSEVVVDI